MGQKQLINITQAVRASVVTALILSCEVTTVTTGYNDFQKCCNRLKALFYVVFSWSVTTLQRFFFKKEKNIEKGSIMYFLGKV